MVTSLRFDDNCGAVLVNEEYMNIRNRRKLYLDPAQSLLTEEMADEWKIEAVYAGCGNPGINQEIYDTVSKKLRVLFDKYSLVEKNKPAPPTLEEISQLCGRAMQNIIRRDQNLKLNLFYGFQADDLNQGSYKRDGREWEIKQEKVKENAAKIVNGSYKDKNSDLFNKTRALLFGFDGKYGICAYHIDITNGNIAFNLEAYEAIGDGKYGVQTSFSKYLNNMSSAMRKNCKDRINGIYELIKAGLTAREAFNFTGGNFTLIVIKGDEKNHAKRYREYGDEQGRLLMHIVEAREASYIDHETMKNLLKEALDSSLSRQEIEEKLFGATSNPRGLDFVLRGYKIHEIAKEAAKWKKSDQNSMAPGKNKIGANKKAGKE